MMVLDPNGYPDKNVDITQDPYITWTKSGSPGPTDSFLDVPGKAIYRIYTHYRRQGDEQLLAYAYPGMMKALGYIQAHIQPGDHLPLDTPGYGPSTYDVLFVQGHGIYNSQLYMLSLEILVDATNRLIQRGDPQATPATVTSLQADLAAAKSEFELLFWDPVQGYYRFRDAPGPNADAEFLDTFFSQHIAERLGLPDLVDPSHYQQQLKESFPKFMLCRDSDGDLLGAPNIAQAACGPSSRAPVSGGPSTGLVTPPSAPEAYEVWTGTNYEVAATYIAAGRRFGDTTLTNDGLAMGQSIEQQVWEKAQNGLQFDPPENWSYNDAGSSRYPGYTRERAVWDLLDDVQPVQPPNPSGRHRSEDRRG
jgi:non-lysosomal glucosylceramidase